MSTPHTLWYKQFWPWALIALPSSAVVASLFTAYLAAYQPDALVADDYYKAGLAINQQLAAKHEATQRHVSAQARLDVATAMLLVDLQGELPSPPARLLLRLVHPTLAKEDHTLTLTRNTAGRYTTRWPLPFSSHTNIRWQALLNDADRHWELTTHVILPQQTHWQFTANAQGDAT